MLFRQFVNDDLGCASYLIGCEDSGEAVVVDPPLAIDELLAAAADHDVRIVRTIETHTHADHVSGHGRLALELGVPVSIHPIAAVEYPFDPLEDGDEVHVGNVSLVCLHTPGHRPEHCCFAVIDHTRADEPWLVLTGDSLFVGDTARPDLAVGGAEGATALHASLRRLLALSDGVEVYPGHVSGSLCGKGMSSKGSSTIGFERRFNPMLAFSELSAFVAASAAVDAPKPPNLTRIVAANHGTFVGSTPLPQELAHPPAGAQLLDVRPVAAFFAGHTPGAVNVPVSGSRFSTKAGFVLDAERPVCLLADTHAEALRAAAGLRSVAFFDLAGYVLGGGTEKLEPVRLDELDGLITGGAVLLDVREENEHAHGAVAGSLNVPYHLVTTAPVPQSRTLVTICETGPRACIAASVLRARGFDARPVAEGGTSELIVRLAGSTA